MNRYKLRANYDIENIDSHKVNGTVVVDTLDRVFGKLNYGLSNIKRGCIKNIFIRLKLDLILCLSHDGLYGRYSN